MDDDAPGPEDDVLAVFAAYAAAFDDADAATVTDLFAYPATLWQFGRGHVFEDADDLLGNVEKLIDALDAEGVVVTTPEILALETAGAAAFARVSWTHADDTGEALMGFTASYLLVRTPGAPFRIAAVWNEDL